MFTVYRANIKRIIGKNNFIKGFCNNSQENGLSLRLELLIIIVRGKTDKGDSGRLY